jgi:hypothetical protein
MKVKPTNHTSAYTAALLNELPPGLYPSNPVSNAQKVHYSKLTGKPVRKQKNPCKSRLSWTKAQKTRLETFYQQDPDPTFEMREMLSKELGVETRSVQFWFQNRRSHDPHRAKHKPPHPVQIPSKKTIDPFNRFNTHLAPHQSEVLNYMGYNFLDHHTYSSSSTSSNSSYHSMQHPATTTPTPVLPNSSMFESNTEVSHPGNYDSMNSIYYSTPMSEPGLFNQTASNRYAYPNSTNQQRGYSPTELASIQAAKSGTRLSLDAATGYSAAHQQPSNQHDYVLDYNSMPSAGVSSVTNSPYVNLFSWQ